MVMELRQQARMTQQLRMTPRLQQAIKLLQLSRMELIAQVRQEMVENPVLEEMPDAFEEQAAPVLDSRLPEDVRADSLPEPREDRRPEHEIDWEAYLNSDNARPLPENSYRGLSTEDYPSAEMLLTQSESLFDYLLSQLRLAELEPLQESIGTFLIGNLDDAGFLTGISVEEISLELGVTPDVVDHVLALVQEFDPPGVAARDLAECLSIQARKLYPGNRVVASLIGEHLPSLERKSYSKIARAMGMDIGEVIEGARLIAALEPRPGRSFETGDARYITPDIYVVKSGDDYVAILNDDGLPRLRISGYYKRELARSKGGAGRDEVREYLQDKLRGATWLIRSIQQRQSTILKVTESIIRFQRDFFDKGVEHLRPLVLRDVAQDIEMHESTISRVTNNKYVYTPRGVFELKYFFNSSITHLAGEDLASEAVKARIRELIASEDPKNPLSDARIAEVLLEGNIDIARRTVAKYREMMGILSSSKRKQMF